LVDLGINTVRIPVGYIRTLLLLLIKLELLLADRILDYRRPCEPLGRALSSGRSEASGRYTRSEYILRAYCLTFTQPSLQRQGLGWLADAGIDVILDHHAAPGVQTPDSMFAGR
jgi:aryl-phospho-beta-D-glucosidase BglC (GH1 family)